MWQPLDSRISCSGATLLRPCPEAEAADAMSLRERGLAPERVILQKVGHCTKHLIIYMCI